MVPSIMFDNSIGTVPTTCLSLPNNTNIDTNIYLFIYFYALTDARKKKGGGREEAGVKKVSSVYSRFRHIPAFCFPLGRNALPG